MEEGERRRRRRRRRRGWNLLGSFLLQRLIKKSLFTELFMLSEWKLIGHLMV